LAIFVPEYQTMAKKKLSQWAEMKTFSHVVEPTTEEAMSGDHELIGSWNNVFFNNTNPIILELGCGKGEYCVGMGRKYPNRNFIGVDIKGHRMWRGAKTAEEESLDNVGFLRTRIDFIDQFFAKGEVSEIWLTFSDPQPGKARKRLTSPLFINRYRKILSQAGLIHLKTDSDLLFEYTLNQCHKYKYDLLYSTDDLYGASISDMDDETSDILGIRTHYESIWLAKGKTIKYCKFKIHEY